MGVQYGNFTLYRVEQDELFEYLSKIGRDAYVSPTMNKFTTVYDKAGCGLNREDIAKLIKLDSRTRSILNQYRGDPYSGLVCLARHLCEKFSCPALAVHVYDGDIFWYHLCQNGEMLDEYTTHGDDNWQPGKVLDYFPINPQIKGGDAKKLCTAFDKELAIEQVDSILRKPTYIDNSLIENSAVCTLNLPRYLELRRIKNYSPLERHEALARGLGMCPGLVVNLNYLAIDTGEFSDQWEDFRDYEDDDFPTLEEVDLMLKKTILS